MGYGDESQKPCTTNLDNLFDTSNFVSVLPRDFAKIGLDFETTMVLLLTNLLGTVGHADRFDP